ncbi:hypothetical protein KAFR_0D03430 [Kazachstania africana CBS 2517]|uniref:PITH domain-containing protein n=1 Tax=Kazachstania africana (strain ATCC 22294 / BCRC 22015 / CBS 2517 / CECT 1963 / NBRC 1671 / NRRL Y-8276) TaxID=1071382 RepID=H2AUE1_KAZAF|nr:hypothetical protein KAFR_0D03430 [Kazachstania africana CBS 2517]CCF57991.1 hypothetical protein KAFR_0D03430 [Kazachstania africana CBS 2517]
MSHHCEHEHHDHRHDHTPPATTYATQSLFEVIDTPKIKVLNGIPINGQGANVFIKAQNERADTTRYLQSDTDCQIVIHIPFLSSCKLYSMIIRANNELDDEEFSIPKEIYVYKNFNKVLNFDSVNKTKNDLQLVYPSLQRDKEDIEFHLPKLKFQNTDSITLFIKNNWSQDEDLNCKIFYIEIRGEINNRLKKSNETNGFAATSYESRANPLDHKPLESSNGFINLGM